MGWKDRKPFPRGEADARGAPGDGHAESKPNGAKHGWKLRKYGNPHSFIEASPFRACASRPLPEGEGDFSQLNIN